MAKHTNPSSICEALQNFDLLPDSAHVGQRVVQALLGCSAATLWRMLKKNSFPAPHRFSLRRNVWNVGEIRKYILEKNIYGNHK